MHELTEFVDQFLKELHKDLQEANDSLNTLAGKGKKADNEVNQFKKDVIKQVQTVFKQKLKDGIAGPILKLGSNLLINSLSERLLEPSDVETIANCFEMSHAINFSDLTKQKYLDKFSIFKAKAQSVNLDKLSPNELKEIHPVNGDKDAHGKAVNFAQMQGLYGGSLTLFVNNTGEFYVSRPSTKSYSKAIKLGKPASLHEQAKLAEILGCSVERSHEIADMQHFVLKRDSGSHIEFVIQKDPRGVSHAMLSVDGELHDAQLSHLKNNDCVYSVMWVANEMAKGKSLKEAQQSLTPGEVNNLRKKVAFAVRHDPEMNRQIRDANRTDRHTHYEVLAGSNSYRGAQQKQQSQKKVAKVTGKVAKKGEDYLYKRPLFSQKTRDRIVVTSKQDRRHLIHFKEGICSPLKELISAIKKNQSPEKKSLSTRLDEMLKDLGDKPSHFSSLTDDNKIERVLSLMNSHEGNLVAGDKIHNQAIEKTRSYLDNFLNNDKSIETLNPLSSLKKSYAEMFDNVRMDTDRTKVTHGHLGLLQKLINNETDYQSAYKWIVDFKNSTTIDIAHDKTTKQHNMYALESYNSIARAQTLLSGATFSDKALDQIQDYIIGPFKR